MRPGAGVAPSGLPAAVRETLQIFWESPFPATLQDQDFLIVDVNDAFVEFSGFDRAALVGRDTLELQHEEDRAANREKRKMCGSARFKSCSGAPKMPCAVAAAGAIARGSRWPRSDRPAIMSLFPTRALSSPCVLLPGPGARAGRSSRREVSSS